MLLVRETAGDTLGGAVDGVNTVFTTHFEYYSDGLKVFLNGMLLVASLETGYTLSPPKTVTMKIAPRIDGGSTDTLEVEYLVDVQTGGGALGGVPNAPTIDVTTPTMLEGDELKPVMLDVLSDSEDCP
jgi:hypothetical protein